MDFIDEIYIEITRVESPELNTGEKICSQMFELVAYDDDKFLFRLTAEKGVLKKILTGMVAFSSMEFTIDDNTGEIK